MTTENTLTASLEDYLETIFNVIAEKEAVRPKDIAKRLKVANSSVTGALRALADKDLINYAPHDVITLTLAGRTAARDVVRRHEVLRDFFINVLAVDGEEADRAACLMEHSIPGIILERLARFAEFIEVCPRGGEKWIAGFSHNCDHKNSPEYCEVCISRSLDKLKRRNRVENKNMKEMKLSDVKPGIRVRIIRVPAKGDAAGRLADMGFADGSVVEAERDVSPGDPIDVKIKGYHFSLRSEDAEGITVAALDD